MRFVPAVRLVSFAVGVLAAGFVAVPAEGSTKDAAYYRKVCAAEFTPEASEQRAREYRDTEGGTIEELRKKMPQVDEQMLARFTDVADAEFKQQLETAPTLIKLKSMASSDPLLRDKAIVRVLYCLVQARVAVMKNSQAAAPSPRAPSVPATAAKSAPPPAKPIVTASKESAAKDNANGRFLREAKGHCLHYKLVNSVPGEVYSKYVFSFINKCGVDITYNSVIKQDGVWVNALRAGGTLGIGQTGVHEQTVPASKTFSVLVTSACETKEAAEKALGRRIASFHYSEKDRACAGWYWQAPLGGVAQ